MNYCAATARPPCEDCVLFAHRAARHSSGLKHSTSRRLDRIGFPWHGPNLTTAGDTLTS